MKFLTSWWGKLTIATFVFFSIVVYLAATFNFGWMVSVASGPGPYSVLFRQSNSPTFFEGPSTEIYIRETNKVLYFSSFGNENDAMDRYSSLYWSKDGSLLIISGELHWKTLDLWDLRAEKYIAQADVRKRLKASGGKGIKIMNNGVPIPDERFAYHSEIEAIEKAERRWN